MSLDEVGIVALGSNLRGAYSSSLALLEAAVTRLADVGFRVIQVSRWWRAPAWPNPNDPEYLNGVALVETGLTPEAALGALLGVEQEFGRVRGHPNASRTLDLDLVALGRIIIDQKDLTLPHPRAHLRQFVMAPLAEIAGDWIHPLLGQTARDLSDTAPIGLEMTIPSDPTLPNFGPVSK